MKYWFSFLGRCDKDLDGRITGEEVKQVIMLSASANKLSKLKEQAAEYAALIMEELDVDGVGYIEVLSLFPTSNACKGDCEDEGERG
jgi:respiratory burst oxidase